MGARLQANETITPRASTSRPRLFLRGQIEPAIDHLLTIMRKDREWQDQAARKQLIKFFEALGPKHPATVAGRRKLSAVLFS